MTSGSSSKSGETRSDAWIVIHCGSKTSAEVRLLPSTAPLDDPVVVRARTEGVEYQVDDWAVTGW